MDFHNNLEKKFLSSNLFLKIHNGFFKVVELVSSFSVLNGTKNVRYQFPYGVAVPRPN